MTLPHFALDYRRCTVTEIRRFIRDRTGTTPSKGVKKAQNINTLKELDWQQRFDFLKLPAELRNAVYFILLSGQDGTRSMEILQTSQQTHQEAEPILYDNKTFHVDIELAYHPLYHGSQDVEATYARFIALDTERSPLHESAAKTLPLGQTLGFWPPYLSKAQRLHIAVRVYNELPAWLELEIDNQRLAEINLWLYGLCCRTQKEHALKSVVIELWTNHLTMASDQDIIGDMIWPLNRLQALNGIKISYIWDDAQEEAYGVPPEHIGIEDTATPKHFDTVGRLHRLNEDIKLVVDTRAKLVHLGRTHPEAPIIQSLVMNIEKWKSFTGFMDEAADKRLSRDVVCMEAMIADAISFH